MLKNSLKGLKMCNIPLHILENIQMLITQEKSSCAGVSKITMQLFFSFKIFRQLSFFLYKILVDSCFQNHHPSVFSGVLKANILFHFPYFKCFFSHILFIASLCKFSEHGSNEKRRKNSAFNNCVGFFLQEERSRNLKLLSW